MLVVIVNGNTQNYDVTMVVGRGLSRGPLVVGCVCVCGYSIGVCGVPPPLIIIMVNFES